MTTSLENSVKIMLEELRVTIKLEADETWMRQLVRCNEPYKYQREGTVDPAALQQRHRGNKVDLFYNNKDENNYCKFNYISNATSDKMARQETSCFSAQILGEQWGRKPELYKY